MKKIFIMSVAALMAAMSVNAEVTNMTCAEAYAAAMLLQSGEIGTDTVLVTGYVTNTDEKLSKGQQTFWMDDTKGTTKTFQSYWGNMPEGEETPLHVGDKVSIKGFLMNYNSTAEMKNGDITILERVVVKVDTVEATVCEAVEEGEALNSGDYSEDVFKVAGVVTAVTSTNDTYKTAKFTLTCEDNEKVLTAYNVTMNNGYCAAGDEVLIIGKLSKYNSTLEILGDAEVTKKGTLTIDTIQATVAEALTATKALTKGAATTEVYQITGYVDSIKTAYSADYDNISFYMCDDMKAPAYEFLAYRVKGGADIKVGDKVIVTGNLTHYYKAATEEGKEDTHTYETTAGATYEIIPETAVENVPIDGAAATKIIRNGQLIIISNNVEYTAQGIAL